MAIAKLKFNLNFGGEQVRTLDDLRENFSIEDMLENYHNGMLERWLDARHYNDELEQVKAIQATDARGILAELLRIFGVASDPEEVEAGLSVVDYLEGRRKFWEDLKAGKLDVASQQETREKSINAYHEGYDALVQAILDHPNDLDYIYDRLDELATEYPNLLKLNAFDLLLCFYEKAPLAGLALFGDSKTRPHYEKYLKIDHLKKLFASLRKCALSSAERVNIEGITQGIFSRPSYTSYTSYRSRDYDRSRNDYGRRAYEPRRRGDYGKTKQVIKPAGEKYIVLKTYPSPPTPAYELFEAVSGKAIDVSDARERFLIFDGIEIEINRNIDMPGCSNDPYLDLMKAR